VGLKKGEKGFKAGRKGEKGKRRKGKKPELSAVPGFIVKGGMRFAFPPYVLIPIPPYSRKIYAGIEKGQ
jgi:hypothetical protein